MTPDGAFQDEAVGLLPKLYKPVGANQYTAAAMLTLEPPSYSTKVMHTLNSPLLTAVIGRPAHHPLCRQMRSGQAADPSPSSTKRGKIGPML